MQTPPQFSAIKIAGERAYDLAREGETVDIPAREVEIGRFDLIEHGDDTRVFEIECGKGTYVRSLARDMGRDLGCYGHIADVAPHRGRPVHGGGFRDRWTNSKTAVAARAMATKAAAGRMDFAALDALLVDTGAALDCLPQVADHRRRRAPDPARQSGDHSRPRCAGRGRGSLRHGARQAGRHRRHRSRHVQAEAGLCRVVTLH